MVPLMEVSCAAICKIASVKVIINTTSIRDKGKGLEIW